LPASKTHIEQDFAATMGQARKRPVSETTLTPGLYVTATPIGNASDITLRALAVLSGVDAILAEDTRVTSRLLAIHGIRRPLLSYNDNNAPEMRPKILKRLSEGQRLALVSDAGTPLVSDPGHKLVRAAIAEGHAVHPIPGPSAALAALSVAGLPTDHFLFAGFLSSKSGERRSALEELGAIPATLIFFESPGRLGATLKDMAGILGDREAAVTRELTKLYEEVRRGTLSELAELYEDQTVKGEITLLVAPPPKSAAGAAEEARMEALLNRTLPFMPLAAAVALVTDLTGAPRRAVYARALELKENGEEA
jgi:16S rRNA (cytidine1402-2'-O)-methyltransferase